jgi:tetratricopeptide (TPR) repeat protein
LLCSFLLLSRVPVAQAATPEQMQQAAATFEIAEKNYKVGDYEKALEGYKEAYVLSGEADLLFNIGQCQRKLNRNEEAIRSYKNFLQERPNTPIKSDVEAIIRELELAQNTPIKDEKTAPLLFGGTDTFFSIGGGILLAEDPLPMVSVIVEAKSFELQGQVAALNALLGGLDFGGHIVSSPRSDQNVRSLLNISAGLSLSSLFSRDKLNNALGEVIVTNNLSFFAGLYGANSFYITCNFSARGELQFVLEALNRQSVGGVATIVKDGELDSALFISLSAHYNLRRDPCPK